MKGEKRILSVILVSSIALTSVVAPTLVAADDFDSKIEQKDQEISNLKINKLMLKHKSKHWKMMLQLSMKS